MTNHHRFWRRRVFALLWTASTCATMGSAQTTSVKEDHSADRPVIDDRAFASVPFEKWLEEGDQGKFRWSARVSPGELSSHQRLRVRIEMQVDGNDLVNRRGHGYLAMLVQFEDAEHRIYRTHGALDLQQVNEAAAKSDIIYTQYAFVRPGEYRVGLVIFDTQTGEHSALQKRIRANPLKNDPFPAAWDDLPPVEFAGSTDAPDAWYLPNVSGRLRLPLETRRPIHLEVLLNASPTATGPGAQTGRVNNRSLENLLPALKVISQIALRKGTVQVSLLDVTRQSVLFEQTSAGELDWPQLRAALMTADPNKIDARSLEKRERNAQFFVDQLQQRMIPAGDSATEPVRVGIVLSGPMAFESSQKVHPIEVASGSGSKLFYIRYHAAMPIQTAQPAYIDPSPRGRRNQPGLPFPKPAYQEPLDALASLVKPLQPHLFDVYTPEQFRKALSVLLEEVSRL